MTSTPFNVGLSDSKRNSSRVLRPPGGGHTDIFGSEPEPLRTGRRQMPAPVSQISTGTESHEQNGQVAAEAPVMPEPAPTNNVQAENGNADVVKAPENAAAPVAKEVPAVAPAAKEAPAPEPPKRVRVPPGGFSSGLW